MNDSSFITNGGMDFDYSGWVSRSPKMAAIIIYAVLVVLFILLIIVIVQRVKKSEPYGNANMLSVIDKAGAGQPYFKEDFENNVSVTELSPTTTPIVDGTDEYGAYRLGQSGAKYYPIMDKDKQYIKWGEGYILYRSAADLMGGTFANDSALHAPGSIGFAATCKSDNLSAYEKSPWGWAAKTLGNTPSENFSVEDQDQLLIQKSMGL